MKKTLKQLLEITQIESAQGRIEELDRFLDITRSFSLKCSAHIRVLTNLVNNLVESEDWLELVDSDLKLPEKVREEAISVNTGVIMRKEVETDSIFDGIRSENEKLLLMIQKNGDNTEYLRELLAKLLEGIKGSTMFKSDTTFNIRKECSHQHCCEKQVTKNAAEELALSDYNLRGGDAGPNLVLKNLVEKLSAENSALKNELQQTKARGFSEENGLKEMLKKLMEVKSQSENKIREKEKALDDLKRSLDAHVQQLEIQDQEIAELKKNNEVLEDTLQELLHSNSRNRTAPEAPLMAQDALISALKDENAALKDTVKSKSAKADEKLRVALRDLDLARSQLIQLKNSPSNSPDIIPSRNDYPEAKDKVTLDFLKCCYNQAAYIEDFLMAEPPINMNFRF